MSRPVNRRLSTDELYPDLAIRRSIRAFANKERNPEKLQRIRDYIGGAYRRLQPAEAIERFSYEEKSVETLQRVLEFIQKIPQ